MKPRTGEKITIKCPQCGTLFERYKSKVRTINGRRNGTYCSRKCLAASKTRGASSICQRCGKPFHKCPADHRKGAVLHCSRACYRAAKREAATGYVKDGGRHEHRVVAEKLLGRPLAKGEVVHHIDGNRKNNKPENLMVFADQASHAAWHGVRHG